MPRLPLLAIGALVASTLLLTGPSAVPADAIVAHQDPALASEWEPSGLTGPVYRIFVPSSGALLAGTATALVRSDDGGTPPSWRPLTGPGQPLSEPTGIVVVDPTNHDVLYTSNADGLVKSLDGGRSWSVILPTVEYAHGIAVSPANHDVVYVGLGKRGSPGDFRFIRSRDGGLSWEQLEQHMYMSCGWGIPILLWHPTDENRLFRTADCRSAANFYDHLRQSLDQGTSWTTLFGVGRPGISSRDSNHPQFAYPTRLAGGQGAEPGRYYLVTHRDSRVGRGTSLFRSDDDAQTWTEMLASRPGIEPDGAIIQLGGLAYDPARPDTVYLGRNVYVPSADSMRPLTFVSGGVLRSADGGASWQELGRQDLPEIHSLALGVDRRYLYLADKEDLRRLRLE